MTKKILAMLLAVALTVALAAPAISTTAKAAAYNPYHCICGAKQYASAEATEPSSTNGKCNCDGVNHTWTAWTFTGGETISTSGYYYLTGDKTVSSTITLSGNIEVTLDLAGKTLSSTGRMFTLNGTGSTETTLTFNVSDSVGGGEMTTTSAASGAVIWDNWQSDNQKAKTVNIYGGKLSSASTSTSSSNGTAICMYVGTGYLNIYGGEITGSKTSGKGGTIYLDYSKCTIYGGVINGVSTNQGGAFYMNSSGARLNINGGVISGGSATTNGGTIFQNAGQLTMTGGVILGGTAGYGGGAICTLATTKISGGAILGGTAQWNSTASADKAKRGGGAIFVAGGTTTISGDAVIGSATYEGTKYTSKAVWGAVIHQSAGALNITGGTICGEATKADDVETLNGGAICVYASTTTISGGTIFAGYAKDNGGGIALFKSGTKLEMSGGTIDATGVTSGHGVAIGNNAGEVIITDGKIIGGNTTGSGGTAISSFTSGNKLTINGGIITGGIHNGSNTVGRGGAVRVSGGTLVMTGGTITGGTNKVGVGGGLMVTGTSSATISGNVVITGNTDKNGNASNLYLDGDNKITFGEGGLGKDANIGITMTTPGTFVSAGATTKNLAYFSADADGSYIALDGTGAKLTNDLGNNTAAIGSALYPTINDAIAAITDRNSQSVKLVQDTNEAVTVDGDLYLDLNGKTLSGNITVNNGTLKAFDSKTADYDVSDGVYGKITGTVTGNIARSFVNGDDQRYLVIKTDEGYSAHRIYLAVTHSVLDSNNFSAMNYKTVFMCDEVIAKLVSDYGVTVKAEEEGSYSYFLNSSVAIDAWDGMKNNEKTTAIKNFLIAGDAENEKRAETSIQVNAYITLKDDIAGNVTSAPKTRSLKQMVEGVLATQWDSQLFGFQKKTLRQVYDIYNTGGFMNRWSNIEKVQNFDPNTAEKSIQSVGYAAVNIDPVDDKGNIISVGLMGYGNEGTRLTTGVDDEAPLMAICLAVTDQTGNTVLLISVDSASVGNGVAKRIVSQISANYGVPEGNIMISSNHQHSTPVFNNADYNNLFVERIVEGARLALADRKEVTSMVAQTVHVGENTYNHVRNEQYIDANGNKIPGAMYTPNHNDADRGISYSGKVYESTADDAVQVVKIIRGNAEEILLTNFQTHPQLGTNRTSTIATADTIGIFRNELAKSTGCLVMYFTGASGNIKIDDTYEYNTQGKKLAQAVNNGINNNAWVSVVSESTGGVEVMTVTRNYGVMLNSVPTWLRTTNPSFANMTDDQILEKIEARAAEIWDGSNYGTWKKADLTTYGIYSIYHAKYIVMRSTNKETDTKSLTISAIAIGDLAFVVVPYEMYDTNGMWIKENSPYKMTFTTHLAGMPTSSQASLSNGYIPSAQSYANGGYSVDIAQFAAGTGESLAQDYIYILNELYN